MAPCLRHWEIFNTFFLQTSVDKNLISLKELALAGDGTPLYTSAQEHKTRTCDCLEKGIRDCKCDRIYHQPDCDIGWDSHRNCFYCGYDLYMLTASDSVFPPNPLHRKKHSKISHTVQYIRHARARNNVP